MFGRNGDAHMHVVRHRATFQDFAFFLPCQIAEYRAELFGKFQKQYLSPSFRDEHYMVFAIPF